VAVITLRFYDPSDGSLLGSLDDTQCQQIELRPALYELGAGTFTVSRHLAAAEAAMLQKGTIVTATIPVISANPFWGFVLHDDLAVLISHEEQGGEDITLSGPGIMSVLGDARLDEEWYAPSPPASDARGSSTQTGKWFWRNQAQGAIFTRAVEEGQSQPGEPLALVTIDFDRDDDSDSVPWTVIVNDYMVDTGTSVLELADRLAQTGEFTAVMVPVLTAGVLSLALSAHQTYGTDRTATVRFEKAVNILTELNRSTKYSRFTHLITKDSDNVWRTYESSNPYDQARYQYLDISETNDEVTVEKIATTYLDASELQNEEYELEITPTLLPYQDFYPGDLVTVHTGSGEHDLNESDQKVVAVRIVLDDASVTGQERSLRIVPELSYREVRGMAGTNSATGGPGQCCGPRPPLQPSPAVAATTDGAWNFDTNDPGPGVNSQYDDGGTMPVKGRMVAVGTCQANSLNTTIGHPVDPNAVGMTPRPAASAGTTYTFHFRMRNKGGIGAGPQTMYGGFLNGAGAWLSGFQTNVLATTPNDESWHEYTAELVAPATTATVGWNIESAAAQVDFMVISHGGTPAFVGSTPQPIGQPTEGDPGSSPQYMPIDAVIPHGYLSDSGEFQHSANQLEYDNPALPDVEDVDAALDALVAATVGSGGAVGSAWSMSKTTSQTLTSNADTVITFDRADVDSGSSVIDLANDRFVVPATGMYLVICGWRWETTVPLVAARAQVFVGGVHGGLQFTTEPATLGGSSASNGTGLLSLSAGALVTMVCHPGGAVTPTARGNATRQLSTTFTLVRVSGSGVWTSFTPTLTATGFALGNGTLQGWYKAIDANTYMVQIAYTRGSTTTNGTGQYAFALPVTARATSPSAQVMSATVHDSGTAYFSATAIVGAGSALVDAVIVADSTGSRLASGTAPITWTTGDRIIINGTIQV
jgi:hypothetical protein